MDYFKQENESTRQIFDLEEILEFQLQHDAQVIRGDDYLYTCYIDKQGSFGSALTPLHAMCVGIKEYKRHHNHD